MAITVSLKEIIETMALQSDDLCSYLNTKSGEFVTVTSEELSAVEDGTNTDGLDEDMMATARAVVAGAPYVALPDRFEIHEYKIMVQFAESIDDARVSGVLQSVLHGSGAFRRFKDTAQTFGVMEDWYRFRDQAYEEIAVAWCEENGVGYRRE